MLKRPSKMSENKGKRKMAEELASDVEELRQVRSIAKWPRLLSFIDSEIRNLEKAASVPVSQTPTPAAPIKVPSSSYVTPTSFSFSWDQDNEKVKINIILEGVEQDKMETNFNQTSVDIKFHDVKGKNYLLTIAKLNKEIVPEKPEVVIEPTGVIITLIKASKGNWLDLDLHFKEEKLIPNINMAFEQIDALLDLMKNAHKVGSDERNEMIAKLIHKRKRSKSLQS